MCSLLCRTSNTAVANNRRLLMYTLNTTDNNLYACDKATLANAFICNKQCTMIGETVKELCLIRDNLYVSNLNGSQILMLLNNLCVD